MLGKPRPRLPLSVFSFLSVLLLLLTACGAQGTPTTPSSNTNATATKGGTMIDDLYEEPDSLIPNGSSETFSNIVDNGLYTPLFHSDAKGNYQHALAAEIPTLQNGDISADLKTWKFKLRSDVKWSDGQPVNADDVDFTWKLWNNAKFGAQSTTGYNLITSADVAPDKQSITFHLKQAFSPFISVWTDGLLSPLPKHHFASMAPDAILKSPDNLNPTVTDGAYKMSESVTGDHYTVVRDSNYYLASQGYPYLDKIVFRIVKNQDTILKDFQSGNTDASWFIDVSKQPTYSKLVNYHIAANPISGSFEEMVINFKNPILGKDAIVRRAMQMAIDHNALIKTARHGLASPLCTDHPAGYHPGYQPDISCPKFDPAAANKMLDDDGWVKGTDGYRTKGSQKLEFKYSTTANNKWRADDELILQSNFKDIGIKLNIQNYPASTFFGPFLNGGQHDLAEFESSYAVDPDEAAYLACDQQPPNGANWSFYCSSQMDSLLKQEQSVGDPAQRQTIFNQMHQLVLTDVPWIILYSGPDVAVVKNTVHNYEPGPFGAQEGVGIWTWWCTGGKC